MVPLREYSAGLLAIFSQFFVMICEVVCLRAEREIGGVECFCR